MTDAILAEGPHRRLSRRFFLLLGSAVACMVLGIALVPVFRSLEILSLQIVAALLAIPGFLSCIIAALVLSRCPDCGWPLYFTKTRWGIPWNHPWLDKVCSSCHRDLTKSEPVNLGPESRHPHPNR